MTYYNRKLQINETIKSIGKTTHDNYDIIIVDDCSDEDLYYELLKSYVLKTSNLYIIKVDKKEKDWNNPVIVYNKGILKALELNPEIIILQNSEGYHFGDILKHANNNINENNYFSYGCFSLNHDLTFKGDFENNLNDLLLTYDKPPVMDCENGWYNHPTYNPRGFDFCASISASNLKKLNGYDERYSKCIWYGDDDLKLRIERLGLKIDITKLPESPIVIHQWHDHNYINNGNAQQCKNNGFRLFSQVRNNEINNFVATHINTPNFN